MKRIIAMIVLVVGTTFTTQAQKRKMDQLTIAQRTELKVKKMTLHLDLTDAQIKQVTPIVKANIEERTAMHEMRRKNKDADKKPTSNEVYEMTNKRLDKSIAAKKQMKQILNEEQYKRFEKMLHHKEKRGGKGKINRDCNKKS